jgi:electron transport complex protein RnfB
LPKKLAVINADNCTGCEACIEVCPVDCILLITQGEGIQGVESWCEIDLDRCIGCALCVHVPRRRSEPYELTVCPWDAIEMVPTEKVTETVARIGGPPDYWQDNQHRLIGIARHVAALKANADRQPTRRV